MKYADLHVHTFYSDSTFSPEEVIMCAKDKALSAVAICDHDSVDGIDPCTELGLKMGVEVVPSIEMTAETGEAEIHLLGYFIDYHAVWLRDKLREIQVARIERVHKMVEKLTSLGIKLEAEDVFKIAGKGTVGRLHVAQAIIKTGKIKNFRDIFGKYLGFLKPAYVSYVKFSPKEAIETILKAGGVPVLAHPGVMKKDELIKELITYGLRGIEVYHTDHREEARMRYEEIARANSLLMTGGSDCHGLGKGRILLGSVRVPYELVEKLKLESEKIKAGR
ncbi:MAG: PHP domain-containing protein [Candidatus Omnitrophota bacterium]|jgi:hypothetical protein